MTGFLRALGLLNAALWFGASVFCSTGLLAAVNSREFGAVVGQQFYPQMSGALMLIVFSRLFYLQIFFAFLAGGHQALEWLYLGRILRRRWVGLLALLLLVSVGSGFWLMPKLKQLHAAQHLPQITEVERTQLERRFGLWHGVFQAVNVVTILGIGAYLVRVSRVQDEPRFVSPFKFRS
jgi:hypothetical protein